MFNLVREVLQSAQWNAFLGRILGFAIGLSLFGNDYLRIALGAQCTRLEKGFTIPNASGIDEKTSFDIIYSIYNEV